jgi:phage pi2 protein 07
MPAGGLWKMKRPAEWGVYALLFAASIWFWLAVALNFGGQGTRLTNIPVGNTFGTTLLIGSFVLMFYFVAVYRLYQRRKRYGAIGLILCLLILASVSVLIPVIEKRSIVESKQLAEAFGRSWVGLEVTCDKSAAEICAKKPKLLLAETPKFASNLYGRYEYYFQEEGEQYVFRLERGYDKLLVWIYKYVPPPKP